MKFRKIGLLLALPIAALVLFGVNFRPPAAHATVTDVITITQTNCILLTGNVDWNDSKTIDDGDGAAGVTTCQTLDQQPSFDTLVRVLNGDPTNPQPSDFTKIDMDAGQVHDKDGIVFVVAFVSNDDTVGFYADNGIFTTAGNNKSSITCGKAGDPGVDFSDNDCDKTPNVGDGVVVARWIPNGAPRGDGQFRVRQGGSEVSADYKIVGEPDHVSLKAFDTAIQTGAPTCELFSDTPTFLESVTEPETTPLDATVYDSDDTPITGAVILWSVDDTDKADFVKPPPLRVGLTPSLDLAALGLGAPEVLCGGSKTGNVKITATITTGADVLPSHLGADLDAPTGRSASITLPVQSEPVAMSLAAVPPSLVCDGTASSTITANLTDDNSKAVVNGNLVHFSVKALGSANPIDARTTSGASTTVLTPLSGAINGVLVQATWMRHVVKGPTPTPVFTPLPPTDTPAPAGTPVATPYPVSTPAPIITPEPVPLKFVASGLTQSFLVNCEQNPATIGELPGAAPAGAPSAVIAPPKTGTGDGRPASWPVALPLGAIAILLIGSGLALRRRKT